MLSEESARSLRQIGVLENPSAQNHIADCCRLRYLDNPIRKRIVELRGDAGSTESPLPVCPQRLNERCPIAHAVACFHLVAFLGVDIPDSALEAHRCLPLEVVRDGNTAQIGHGIEEAPNT